MKIVEQSNGPLAYSLIRADGKVRNLVSGAWEAAADSPTADQYRPHARPAPGLWQPFQVADIPGADGFDLVDDARCYGCFRVGGNEVHAIQDTAQCVASTKKFTWMCWIKASPPAVPNATIIGEGSSSSDVPLFQLRQSLGKASVLEFALRDANKFAVEAAGTIPVDDGGWHHAAVTCDGKNCTLYVDGLTNAAASLTGLGELATGRLCFGGLVRSTLSNTWKGSMDDVRSYKRALAPEEIDTAARRWLAGPTGNGDISVVLWDLDSSGKPIAMHHVFPLGWVVAGNPRPGGSV